MVAERGPYAIPKLPKIPKPNPAQAGIIMLTSGTAAVGIGQGIVENAFPLQQTIGDYFGHLFSRSLESSFYLALTDYSKMNEASPFGTFLITTGSVIALLGLLTIYLSSKNKSS